MRRLPVLLTLLLAAFAVNLDTTLVNVALPDLSRQLGASTEQLQWVVDAFNLVFAAFLLSAGSRHVAARTLPGKQPRPVAFPRATAQPQ